jgi:hypothetical protein
VGFINEQAMRLLGGFVGLLHGRYESVEIDMVAVIGGGFLDVHFPLYVRWE